MMDVLVYLGSGVLGYVVGKLEPWRCARNWAADFIRFTNGKERFWRLRAVVALGLVIGDWYFRPRARKLLRKPVDLPISSEPIRINPEWRKKLEDD